MTRLRSTLNPEEQNDFVVSPTRYKVGANKFELVCGFCNEKYYVDDVTFRHALSAMEEGIDNRFCCDDCEDEQEATSH